MCQDMYGELFVPCVYREVGAMVRVASEDNLGRAVPLHQVPSELRWSGISRAQPSAPALLHLPNAGITSIQTTSSQMIYF